MFPPTLNVESIRLPNAEWDLEAGGVQRLCGRTQFAAIPVWSGKIRDFIRARQGTIKAASTPTVAERTAAHPGADENQTMRSILPNSVQLPAWRLAMSTPSPKVALTDMA
jgi:hypothetical protein